MQNEPIVYSERPKHKRPKQLTEYVVYQHSERGQSVVERHTGVVIYANKQVTNTALLAARALC